MKGKGVSDHTPQTKKNQQNVIKIKMTHHVQWFAILEVAALGADSALLVIAELRLWVIILPAQVRACRFRSRPKFFGPGTASTLFVCVLREDASSSVEAVPLGALYFPSQSTINRPSCSSFISFSSQKTSALAVTVDRLLPPQIIEVSEHDERASSETEGGAGGPMSQNLSAPHDWARRSSYPIHRRSQFISQIYRRKQTIFSRDWCPE